MRRRDLVAAAVWGLAMHVLGCAGAQGQKWTDALAMTKKDEGADTKAVTPAKRIEVLRQIADRADYYSPADQRKFTMEIAGKLPREKDPLVRAQMLRTVAAFPTPQAGAILTAGSRDPDRDVRVACCEAWGIHGGPEATRILGEILQRDADVDVRLAAVAALGNLDDAAAVAALAPALEDPDPALQYRAVQSLRKSTGRDFGDDVNAWRAYVRGEGPAELPLVSRLLRRW